jgi:hypothetical protein
VKVERLRDEPEPGEQVLVGELSVVLGQVGDREAAGRVAAIE